MDPIKPISKTARLTKLNQEEHSLKDLGEKQAPSPFEPQNPPQLPSVDVFVLDSSPLVGSDHFVSGEEVLAASLALFTPEQKQIENSQRNPAHQTMELTHLNYLLDSSSRIIGKTDSNSAELQHQKEEYTALYAAYASHQAQIEKEKKKKKKGWERISEFLKSIFTSG